MSALHFISPVIVLCFGSIFVLLAGLWIKNQKFILGASLLTVLVAGGLYVMMPSQFASASFSGSFSGGTAQSFFSGLLAYDLFGVFFAVFSMVVLFISMLLSASSAEIKPHRRFEYYAILLTMGAGLVFMGMASHFLMIYVGIETVSLLSYALAGFSKEKAASNEASMKYVVYGSLASAVMIYGMSLIYGITGSLELVGIREYLLSNPQQPELLWISLLMVLLGIGFKISAAPMHMWTPDVYQGAPTPVAALLSVAPKAAGFAVLTRLLMTAFSSVPEGINFSGEAQFEVLGPMNWPAVLGISAVVTMFAGNLAALGQISVKRLLAYSSIAHAGYMLMGLTTQTGDGISAIVFYVIAYCFMNIGAFWICSQVEDAYGDDNLNKFKGMVRVRPFHAISMTILLCSLVGLPSFAGFIGKYLLFNAVIAQGFYTLAVIAAVNSAISLFYYMKIVKAMFLEAPEREESPAAARVFGSKPAMVAIAFLVLPTLLLGFFGPAIQWAVSVSRMVLELAVGA